MSKTKRKLTVLVAVLLCIAFACGCGKGGETPQQGPKTVEQLKAEAATQTVTVGDIDVSYRVLGEGDPLLMIMGFSGTMDDWSPDFLFDLAEHYQVIIFDNRGMGTTSAGEKEFTMRQFAADTAGFMRAIGIDKSHVLGWSMGTNIALELVLDYPELVDGLVLYAADPGGEEAILPAPEVMQQLTDTSGTPQQRAERVFALMFPSSWLQEHGDELQEIFMGDIEDSLPENIAKQEQAMVEWDGSFDRLPDITTPTMLLTGSEDILTPPENSLLMVEEIPDAWLVRIRGGGHAMMFQYPQELARIIADFLAAP